MTTSFSPTNTTLRVPLTMTALKTLATIDRFLTIFCARSANCVSKPKFFSLSNLHCHSGGSEKKDVGDAKSDKTIYVNVNDFRIKHGLPVLKESSILNTLCEQHCISMISRNRLDHDGFLELRVPMGARAENVGMGFDDESKAVTGWARSSGHRDNMLRKNMTHFGLQKRHDKTWWWCLILSDKNCN